MARSLSLPEEVKAKLFNPRAKVFTTLERVFDSSVGREYLKVAPDADHGLRGETSKNDFVRAFSKLVTDVVLGKQSSRTLNTNEDIRSYFESWKAEDLPSKHGSFVPAEVIEGESVASVKGVKEQSPPPARAKPESKSIVPRDFKMRFGSARLLDIRRELVRLKRVEFPNAGAVLLRVFFEIAVVDYLGRSGELAGVVEKLKAKGQPIPFGTPTMRQLVPEIIRIAKKYLTQSEANRVQKAIQYDAAAPFSLSDLHAFVHQAGDLPGERDIQQFWLRTEPLFQLMLGREVVQAEDA